jgi:pimeloyl-ACP methyl ester carboxylesterase
MSLTLVCLHGLAQNGAQLAAQLTELTVRFPSGVNVVCPDASHGCPDASLQRVAAAQVDNHASVPYLRWWDDEESANHAGWETTREQLRELCDQRGGVGVLGFDQGATACAALAALHAAGEFPPLEFAIMIAGHKPRAAALAPLFRAPIALASLHVWAEDDANAAVAGSKELVEAFAPEAREVATWKGGHRIPTSGAPADAILALVQRNA